jgi:hypothetical protein
MNPLTMGTLYFIQPAELVGTKRYKIGCSATNDMVRCKSYRKGTRYLMVLECPHPFSVESVLKAQFESTFRRVAGKEYFEGDELEMRRLFYETYLKCTSGRVDMEIDTAPSR